MFWEKFVTRVYRILGKYIRARQRDGAMIDVEPLVVVRAFVGMIIHHSLNNNLWDRTQQLLRISNQVAAREFTRILLHGVCAPTKKGLKPARNGRPARRSVNTKSQGKSTKK